MLRVFVSSCLLSGILIANSLAWAGKDLSWCKLVLDSVVHRFRSPELDVSELEVVIRTSKVRYLWPLSREELTALSNIQKYTRDPETLYEFLLNYRGDRRKLLSTLEDHLDQLESVNKRTWNVPEFLSAPQYVDVLRRWHELESEGWTVRPFIGFLPKGTSNPAVRKKEIILRMVPSEDLPDLLARKIDSLKPPAEKVTSPVATGKVVIAEKPQEIIKIEKKEPTTQTTSAKTIKGAKEAAINHADPKLQIFARLEEIDAVLNRARISLNQVNDSDARQDLTAALEAVEHRTIEAYVQVESQDPPLMKDLVAALNDDARQLERRIADQRTNELLVYKTAKEDQLVKKPTDPPLRSISEIMELDQIESNVIYTVRDQRTESKPAKIVFMDELVKTLRSSRGDREYETILPILQRHGVLKDRSARVGIKKLMADYTWELKTMTDNQFLICQDPTTKIFYLTNKVHRHTTVLDRSFCREKLKLLLANDLR